MSDQNLDQISGEPYVDMQGDQVAQSNVLPPKQKKCIVLSLIRHAQVHYIIRSSFHISL